MSKFTLVALVATFLCFMSCNKKENAPAYVGKPHVEIADGQYTTEVMLSLGRLSDPQLSPDGSMVVYGVSYIDLAANRSCRNLYICSPDGSAVQQLTHEGKSISNARWTTDGKALYYIQGGQIYKASLKGGSIGSFSLGKAAKLSNVSEGISGFELSPDGSKLLYISTVKSSVQQPSDTDPALDKARAYVTEDLMYRHWDHWVTELPHSYVACLGAGTITKENSADILGGPEVKFELPLEPYGGTEQLSWSPDGKYIAYSCKKLSGKQYAFSTNTEIYIYNVATGESTVIPVGGGYDTDPVWSPDGSKLAWISMARDGYEADKSRILMAYIGSEGIVKEVRELTSAFKYNAAGLVWSADSKYIYFNALTEGLQALYRADSDSAPSAAIIISADEEEGSVQERSEPLAGTLIERLTEDNLWYDFGSPFAILDDGTLLASYCSMEFPTELVAVSPSPSGAVLSRISHENDDVLAQLKPISMEQRYVKTVDGRDMLTWVLFPPEFDDSKVYPAIEICLGGPQGTLSQSWSYRWNYRLMASQGYITILPNRRGTTAFGQEWTEQISGDYIGLNMQDYLKAGRELKAEAYVGKLAACGASYGGYSVYYLAGIHGDLYDCFIAHAGIFDEKYMYYETEEMWFPNWDNGGLTEYGYTPGQMGSAGDGITFGGMKQAGSPWSSSPKARRHYSNSPADNVLQWHTPILCIHGCMDFRIPYDQGMAAFNAAQMMGVPSKLVIFPTENHWILEPQNALFWHREYFSWLDKWCK